MPQYRACIDRRILHLNCRSSRESVRTRRQPIHLQRGGWEGNELRPRLARQRLQNFLANAVVILVINDRAWSYSLDHLGSFKEHVDIFNVSKLIVFFSDSQELQVYLRDNGFP